MAVKRIVTRMTPEGKSVFAFADTAPAETHLLEVPGFSTINIWSTEADTTVPGDGVDPSINLQSFSPGPGATRFAVVCIPPDSVYNDPRFDPEAARKEHMAKIPGVSMEVDDGGMHTTDTVDYGVVLDGEVWLELDDGVTQHIKKHDTIVQTGTRHAWRNKSSASVTMAFVMVGTPRRT